MISKYFLIRYPIAISRNFNQKNSILKHCKYKFDLK